MRPSQLEAHLDDFFDSLTGAEREDLQLKTGVTWEEGNYLSKGAAVTVYSRSCSEEKRINREDHLLAKQRNHEQALQKRNHDHQKMLQQEDHEYRRDLQRTDHQFQEEMQEREYQAEAILEQKRWEANLKLAEYNNQQLQQMLDRFAEYMVRGIKGSLEQLPREFAELGKSLVKDLNTQRMLPSGEKNAIKRIAGASHCIGGPEGPDNCVYAYETDNGIYHQCMIASAAQNRSVLGFEIINHDVLKQAGCPLNRSGTISRQFLSGLAPGKLTEETCHLYDGQAHKARGLP